MTNLVQRWKASEPVRLYVYGGLLPIIGLLVAAGVITRMVAVFVVAGLAFVLGFAGTEAARASVVAPLSLVLPGSHQVAQAAMDSVPAEVVQAAMVRKYAGRHRTPEADQ